jgi:hypothetical protein
MKYIDNQIVKIGDIIQSQRSDGVIYEGKVIKIIKPKSSDSKIWGGDGILVEGVGLGLSLWKKFDEDIILIKRVQ